MEQKYSLNDIMLEAMEKFDFEDEYHEKIPDRVRKKFEKYVQNTRNQEGKTLWEASEDHKYKDADEKSFHFFTEKDKNAIIYSDEIYDYLIARSKSEKIKNQPTKKSLNKMVEKAKEDWENALAQADFPSQVYTGITPSEKDIMEEKNSIMFTALFELFFNPIDEKLLSDDIFNSYYYGGNTETAATMDSKLRHADLHNYFSPRKEVSETLDIILNTLADKIAVKVADKIADKVADKVADKENLFRRK